MQRYIAFLRAINVGGHVVKMDHLRHLFEEMGFAAVETYIASGNVIFESEAGDPRVLEQTIAARLREALGYEVATFIRTAAELAEIARYQPFAAAELDAPGVSLYVFPAVQEKFGRAACFGAVLIVRGVLRRMGKRGVSVTAQSVIPLTGG